MQIGLAFGGPEEEKENKLSCRLGFGIGPALVGLPLLETGHAPWATVGLAVEFAGLLVRRVLLGQLVLGPKMAPKTNKNRPKWASS